MIYETIPVNNYSGNNYANKFDFDFYIENESQLVVYFYDKNSIKQKLELNVDYSINELKNEEGSYITFPLPSSKYSLLKEDEKISLELTLPISQESQYNNSGRLDYNAIEYSFDYVTRLIQILARRIERCVKVEECSTSAPDELLESITKANAISKEHAQTAIEQLELIKKQADIIFEQKNKVDEVVKNQLPVGSALSNTLLSSPKRINLDLTNGVLTLKAGSIVIIPDGFENDGVTPKFIYQEIASDVVMDKWGTHNSLAFCIYHAEVNIFNPWEFLYSGPTAPTSAQQFMIWYDTKNNLIKQTVDTGATWKVEQNAFPICYCQFKEGKASSISQTFDIQGYIGSAFWLSKGAKILIPNGRNADSTLNNIELILDKTYVKDLSTVALSTNSKNFIMYDYTTDSIGHTGEMYYVQDDEPPFTPGLWFDTSDNLMRKANSYSTSWYQIDDKIAVIGTFFVGANSKITKFSPYYPLDLLKRSDRASVAGYSMPSNKYINLTLGATGTRYVAPANGYVQLTKYAGINDAFIDLYNATSQTLETIQHAPSSGNICSGFLPVKRGDSFDVHYNATGNTKFFRFVYAQGEV